VPPLLTVQWLSATPLATNVVPDTTPVLNNVEMLAACAPSAQSEKATIARVEQPNMLLFIFFITYFLVFIRKIKFSGC
jgi:hypothetical protein